MQQLYEAVYDASGSLHPPPPSAYGFNHYNTDVAPGFTVAPNPDVFGSAAIGDIVLFPAIQVCSPVSSFSHQLPFLNPLFFSPPQDLPPADHPPNVRHLGNSYGILESRFQHLKTLLHSPTVFTNSTEHGNFCRDLVLNTFPLKHVTHIRWAQHHNLPWVQDFDRTLHSEFFHQLFLSPFISSVFFTPPTALLGLLLVDIPHRSNTIDNIFTSIIKKKLQRWHDLYINRTCVKQAYIDLAISTPPPNVNISEQRAVQLWKDVKAGFDSSRAAVP
jgi:hypothetical protein